MTYNSFGEYLKSLPSDTVFRLWEYKRIFTPYEEENKFIDQCEFKNKYCSYVKILDTINLPNGDIMLAAQSDDDYIDYYRLSEIKLVRVPSDMEDEE